MSAWFQSWFNEDYHLCYAHRTLEEAQAEVDVLIKYLGLEPRHRVFDMACGAGRHLQAFAQRGFDVRGGDLSQSLLQQLHNDFPALRDRVFQYDMRSLQSAVSERFDVVLNLFTSFGYFQTDLEHRNLLESVAHTMTEEGFFVLDFMNEGFLRHALVTTTQKTVGDVLVEQQRWFSNDDRLINEITIRRGSTNTVYRESVRAYTYPEIELLFRHAGLTVDSVFGGYDLSEYSKETSKRMLIIGRRKELPRSKMRSLVWSADTRGQITSMPSARAA